MISPQPEHGVEQPAVEHSLGQVVDQQQAAEIKGFPVMICYEGHNQGNINNGGLRRLQKAKKSIPY